MNPISVTSALRAGRIFFEGACGTMLQARGLAPGERPENWNLSHPAEVERLHREYLEAGCRILKTNTFGVNPERFRNFEEVIAAAFGCAHRAAAGTDGVYLALDLGPTGRMLEPLGDLDFETCVSLFAKTVRAALPYEPDLILIETMNDALETKAALLAAKENSTLPVFVTNVYDESGKLMTGADPAAMIAMLEGLGADAIGMNCATGPDAMLPLIERFTALTDLPVVVNPNAGLPKTDGSRTYYDLSADDFAAAAARLAAAGASVIGGCCGTTPEYLCKTIAACREIPLPHSAPKPVTLISSYTHAVTVGERPLLIGERINPTGKPKLKEALRAHDLEYLLNEGVRQAQTGVQILDVNVGLPGIDEPAVLSATVTALQGVTDLPLQLDSADPSALAAAMRVYAGKPLVNSVNGKQSVMDAVFPLVQKYGGALIVLTLDETGIPADAAGRLAVAEKICREAEKYGIAKKELIVDPLAMSVSADQNAACVTHESIRLLHANGFHTSLGVSNVSFGLPRRELLNAAFFTCALENGLDCAIVNPFSDSMMDAYAAAELLHGHDAACRDYIGRVSARDEAPSAAAGEDESLHGAICRGLRERAALLARTAAGAGDPLTVIDREIIPALNETGAAFEQKKIFLPQLLLCAEAAGAAFDEVRGKLPASAEKSGHPVLLATVHGDIHDIGKNIVKVLLESYGFTVIDLGRDVPEETVRDAALRTGCRLVGLSALMTTTLPAMERTVSLLHEADPAIRVAVGGAVLNPEYAAMIGADFYGRDAMDTVRIAQEFYREK